MAEPSNNPPLCPRCVELEAHITGLEAHIAKLEARIAKLEQLLEQTTRKGKRQAAPFSRNSPKPNPKPPGRKPGPDYGTPAFRAAPPAGVIDEVHEARLPDRCDGCGGQVRHTHTDRQYQVELPRRPVHRQFNVHIGRCACCGRRAQGRHPLQTSDALGAAASQLGPDLQALIVHLNKDAGLSHGKIQRLLKTAFGIELSRGGVVQSMMRAAKRCGSIAGSILQAMPRQLAVTPDETGWRIGGTPAWLHAFVSKLLTGYVIDRGRGADVPERVLGLDYAGKMTHDGWVTYDRFALAIHQQCVAHFLRRCMELIESGVGRAKQFPRQVKDVFRDALKYRDLYAKDEITTCGLRFVRRWLEHRLDDLLRRPRANAPNERFAGHLIRHRDQLLTFLYHPGMDATNYRAEQAIRPAVVNRKVWGGNRTEAGAHAQSVLMTVLRTCVQQHRDPLTFVSRVLRGERPRLQLA